MVPLAFEVPAQAAVDRPAGDTLLGSELYDVVFWGGSHPTEIIALAAGSLFANTLDLPALPDDFEAKTLTISGDVLYCGGIQKELLTATVPSGKPYLDLITQSGEPIFAGQPGIDRLVDEPSERHGEMSLHHPAIFSLHLRSPRRWNRLGRPLRGHAPAGAVVGMGSTRSKLTVAVSTLLDAAVADSVVFVELGGERGRSRSGARIEMIHGSVRKIGEGKRGLYLALYDMHGTSRVATLNDSRVDSIVELESAVQPTAIEELAQGKTRVWSDAGELYVDLNARNQAGALRRRPGSSTVRRQVGDDILTIETELTVGDMSSQVNAHLSQGTGS